MQVSTLIRISLLIFLIVLAQLQLTFATATKREDTSQTDPVEVTPVKPELVRTAVTNISLPLSHGDVSQHETDWAIKYLRLPTWSSGYIRCDTPGSEVSCFEVVRAAKTIHSWERKCIDQTLNGTVIVRITDQLFPDTLSMVYHAVQIAMATGRRVSMNTGLLKPFDLPSVLHSNVAQHGYRVQTDYHFGCCDVSERFPAIKIDGASWPQVMYTHKTVGPFLRENFGFHAAYFIGNWLFGSVESPGACASRPDWVVEGWKFVPGHDLRVNEFPEVLWKRGVKLEKATLVTNVNSARHIYYSDIHYVRNESKDEVACAMWKIISAENIVQTFGSRLGWWSNALQGKRGAFLNWLEMVAVNLTYSQQGSLWHTMCPNELGEHIYRINGWLWICGPNAYDVKMYLDYLLW